jgi:predicted negative regulator of RcsB-dependent stress response
MAEEILDSHEQGEAVRKWLQSNGSSILVGVAVGLAALFGYQRWQDSKVGHAAEAMLQFQQLQSAAETDEAGFEAYLKALTESYQDTPFATMALFTQADRALQAGDDVAAVAALRQAVEVARPDSLGNVARLRLTRALIASGEADEALRQLDQVDDSGFKAMRAELRGDALALQGKTDAARTAYEEALSLLDVASSSRELVEMKLAEQTLAATATTPPAPAVAPEAPAEQAPAAPEAVDAETQGSSS